MRRSSDSIGSAGNVLALHSFELQRNEASFACGGPTSTLRPHTNPPSGPTRTPLLLHGHKKQGLASRTRRRGASSMTTGKDDESNLRGHMIPTTEISSPREALQQPLSPWQQLIPSSSTPMSHEASFGRLIYLFERLEKNLIRYKVFEPLSLFPGGQYEL